MRGTVTETGGEGNRVRGGRGRDSTVVTRPRLLATLFVCVVAIAVIIWLALALVFCPRE